MELIDVTLRESVFCDAPITIGIGLDLIKKLAQINADYIEIGYLKKDAIGDSVFLNYDREYIERAYFIVGGKSKLSAMIHPEDFYSNNWDTETIKKLSLIRIAFDSKNIDRTGTIIKYFHELGIKVSLNLTHVSCYTVDQCLELARLAEKNGADIFYVADSNGNLFPEDVEKYMDALLGRFGNKITFGFHAHDNLGLAPINAIKALERGIKMVDSSITGYGKGSGNLRTELFPLLLLRKKMNAKEYDLELLFEAACYFNEAVTKLTNFEEQYKYSLLGSINFGLKEDKEIKKISSSENIKDYELAIMCIKECGCDLQELKKVISNKQANNNLSHL